jgi:multicomponent Na+:H+ antiporter subunit C
MTTVLAIVIGVLYAAGLYMMLRRSLFKLVLGLAMLSHGANLLIFTAAGLTRAEPPIILSGELKLPPNAADPLPQALILTAIVISFGVLAFALVLFHRTHQALGTDDSDDLRKTEP